MNRMPPSTAPAGEARSKTSPQRRLAVIYDWVRKHRDQILAGAAGKVLGAGVIAVLGSAVIFWRHIPSAMRAAGTWLLSLMQPILVPLWLLVALPFLTLGLLILVQYCRQYRYRRATFFGVTFTWLYLTPFGRVWHVRARCPRCGIPATEPTFPLWSDNYVCRACDYDTLRIAGRMEYPWHKAIQKRVYERLYKPPAS